MKLKLKIRIQWTQPSDETLKASIRNCLSILDIKNLGLCLNKKKSIYETSS